MDVLSDEEGGEGGDIPEQYFQGHDDQNGGEDAGQYQQSHVEFVSSGKGTTPQEILLIGLPIHASLFLLTSLALWRGNLFSSLSGSLLELLIICLPPLLSLTTFSSSPELLVIPLTACGSLALLLAAKGRSKVPPASTLPPTFPRVAYITNYRASMLLITTICILAVDFPVFPRRLAKTENFGFGLMDLGVGSFVFSAGLVSAEARGLKQSLARRLSSLLPLITLGLVRLGALSLTGYHHVVTEYGVHWNFFFSLAAVSLLSAIFSPLLNDSRKAWLGSVAVAVAYEGLLAQGAQAWVLGDTPRLGLIEANREGLMSSLGYLALHLAGVSWGSDLLFMASTPDHLLTSAGLLIVWSALMWGALAYSSTLFPPASRRLANYNFFTWTLAYNLTLLAGFAILDLLLVYVAELQDPKKTSKSIKSKKASDSLRIKLLKKSPAPSNSPPNPNLYRSPGLYRAISQNSLAFFLAANLATGAVNLCVSTISTATLPALAILSLYLGILSLSALLLWHYKVVLKFW